MRIDKFLKVSRLIKRRTLAKEVGLRGDVWLNGRPAKPGDRLKVGDLLTIDAGPRRLTVEVLVLRESVPAAEAGDLYRVVAEERRPVAGDL